METTEECLLKYRRKLRQLLADCGVASNPGVTDDWILVKTSQLINDAKRAGKTQALPVVTRELKSVVTDFFAQNIYKGYATPFKLKSIQPSTLNSTLLDVIPEDIDDEMCPADKEWEKRLSELGKKFNARLVIPYWCYAK